MALPRKKPTRKGYTMANAMTVTSKVDGANVTIKNGALQKETQRIIDALNDAKNSLYIVAFTLNKINTGKLYEADGFADIYDYGNTVFGYKRAMVNNMIRVGANYLTSDGHGVKSLMAHSDTDYSVSQMQELLTIPVDDAKQLDEAGKINPDMTTKEIRDVVSAYRAESKTAKTARVNTVTEKQIESAYNRASAALDTIERGLATTDDKNAALILAQIRTGLVELCDAATAAIKSAKTDKKRRTKKSATE